jgi:hypothetical protein
LNGLAVAVAGAGLGGPGRPGARERALAAERYPPALTGHAAFAVSAAEPDRWLGAYSLAPEAVAALRRLYAGELVNADAAEAFARPGRVPVEGFLRAACRAVREQTTP